MTTVEGLDALIKQGSLQDVIGAIFAYANLDVFPSDRKLIHQFIRSEKKGEGAQLLEPFVFSEGVDLYPFSRLLESVLMQLQLGGWLSAKNPEYERFGMTDTIRDDIKEKVSKRITEEQLAILQKVGQNFHKFITAKDG